MSNDKFRLELIIDKGYIIIEKVLSLLLKGTIVLVSKMSHKGTQRTCVHNAMQGYRITLNQIRSFSVKRYIDALDFTKVT